MLNELLIIFWIVLVVAGMIYLLSCVAKVLTSIGDGMRSGVHQVKANRRLKAFNGKKCFHCGYDLRANVNRCPECGHHIPIRPIF